MNAVCLIDTSIFVEILEVPTKSTRHEATLIELKQRIQNGEVLFLPMATILETGNHIAQNGNGDLRRRCAELFVNQIQQALSGFSPFKPISFLKSEEIQLWLTEFPDSAMRAQGLGDLSIIHDWKRLCSQNSGRKVYIWSLDTHLGGYIQNPRNW